MTANLTDLLQEVLHLQKDHASTSTDPMRRRGQLVRKEIPEVLRSWLPPKERLRVEGGDGSGRPTRVPWCRIFDPRRSAKATQGFYLVYLFAADGSSVALSLNQGTTDFIGGKRLPKSKSSISDNVSKARSLLNSVWTEDAKVMYAIELADRNLGRLYEQGHILGFVYETNHIPPERTLREDFDVLVSLLQTLYGNETKSKRAAPSRKEPLLPANPALSHNILQYIRDRGFVYEPWEVATFVSAVKSKPFVILAGISGTGKTKLPILAAEATGAVCNLIAVRPDWTDSSDVIGYSDLSGRFRKGPFLEACLEAERDPHRQHLVVLDEMNLARVEQYFAEVLSHVEDMSLQDLGPCSFPIANLEQDGQNLSVQIPDNLAIIGTVNMDESTHAFSRKVLDRAFTIELSSVHLKSFPRPQRGTKTVHGPSSWRGIARRLGSAHMESDPEGTALINNAISTLIEINGFLAHAQLQIGYRTRDEICLFLLNARSDQDLFVDASGAVVDPLDIAIFMKILPRIAGSSHAVGSVIDGLLSICGGGSKSAEALLDQWKQESFGAVLNASRFPRSGARLCLMKERLLDGFTSFYL